MELHRAAKAGDGARIRRLLKAGFKVNEQNDVGWTAAHYAARYGQLSVLQYLITKVFFFFFFGCEVCFGSGQATRSVMWWCLLPPGRREREAVLESFSCVFLADHARAT